MCNYGKNLSFAFRWNLSLFLLSVICRLKPGSHLAQCLAIRTANKDEWQERRAVIKQCDIQLNEDDLHAKKMKKITKK